MILHWAMMLSLRNLPSRNVVLHMFLDASSPRIKGFTFYQTKEAHLARGLTRGGGDARRLLGVVPVPVPVELPEGAGAGSGAGFGDGKGGVWHIVNE